MVDKQPVSSLRKSWGMRKKERSERLVTNTYYSLDIGEDLCLPYNDYATLAGFNGTLTRRVSEVLRATTDQR